MALNFYDNAMALFPGSIAMDTFNGTTGSVVERLMHIRNDDLLTYYTSIVVTVNQNVGLYGDSGFTIKLMEGSRRPTEAEWSQVAANAPLNLPALGAAGAPDTTTYRAFWVRMFCPAGFTRTQVRADLSLECIAVSNPV